MMFCLGIGMIAWLRIRGCVRRPGVLLLADVKSRMDIPQIFVRVRKRLEFAHNDHDLHKPASTSIFGISIT